jgi:PEP-CTERM motif
MKKCLLLISTIVMFFCFDLAIAAPITVYTSDFIPDNTRTNFNGFENLPLPGTANVDSEGVMYFQKQADAYYVEDGIRVEQYYVKNNMGIDGYGIWTTHPDPPEGKRSWYPSGGDDGYTRIMRDDRGIINKIGFYYSNGVSGNDMIMFILLYHGTVVYQGSLMKPNGFSYLGFSGDDFDEVLIRSVDPTIRGYSFFDESPNGLIIDAVEMDSRFSVPEPGTMLLLGFGLAGVAIARKTFQK